MFMKFSQKLIDEYKRIFKEEYGVEYTDQEAQEGANNLVGFFELLAKIDYRSKNKDNK